MSHDIDESIAALHQASLDGFLEGRKALAAKLKKAGDKEGAGRVAALAKPTPSAWATNRVSATARDVFVNLLQNGVALRSAMRDSLRGIRSGDVAGLQREQRETIEALVGEALRLLTEAELPASDVVMNRVRTNVTAIGTSGRWGGAPAACLAKDLSPIDIAALAALLDETLPGETLPAEKKPSEKKPSETEAPRAPKAPLPAPKAEPEVDARAEEEKARQRARDGKRRELTLQIEAAEAAHASCEAALTEHAGRVAMAEVALVEANERSSATTLEVSRLESLLAEARESSALARRHAEARETTLANEKRERERAAQEAIRSRTHVLAVREKLAQVDRD